MHRTSDVSHFRTHEIKRQVKTDTTSKITDLQKEQIENSDILSLDEKRQLLQIALGAKFMGEVMDIIHYNYDEVLDMLVVDDKELYKIQGLLEKLPFPFFLDKKIQKARAFNCLIESTWFQVCANEKIKYLMQYHSDTLSSLELGVLYGYPPTACMAMEGFLDLSEAKQSFYNCMVFSGRNSVEYFEQEDEHSKGLYEKMKNYCPKTMLGIEEQYKKRKEDKEKYWSEWDKNYLSNFRNVPKEKYM